MIKPCCHGALGLMKAALQKMGLPIDEAAPALTQARRDLCRYCEHATRTTKTADKFVKARGLTTLSRCDLCKCIIAAKTMLQSEKCPLSKW